MRVRNVWCVCSIQPALEEAIAKSNPQWRKEWIPGKMLNIWRTLSSQVHDAKKVQGNEMERIIVSEKILPGT